MVWVEATTPPTNSPWISRRTRKITGAATPIWLMVGNAPNSAVTMPTPMTATIIVPRRP
jgi:hypothetical protein